MGLVDTDRMKILHFYSNLDESYGGPAKSIPYSCLYLKEYGTESELFSLGNNKRYYPANQKNTLIEKNKLIWNKYRSKVLPFSTRMYYDIVKKSYNKNTIVHLHLLWGFTQYCGYKLHKKQNLPLIISLRSCLYKESLKKSYLKKSVFRLLYVNNMLEEANVIHVTAEEEYKQFRSLGFKNKVAIIPNGINIEEFTNLPKKENALNKLELSKKYKYILFLSRIEKRKNVDLLVKAFAAVNTKFQDWRLIIAGPSKHSYKNKIMELINRDRMLGNKIIFTGMLKDYGRLCAFSVASLFVLPTKFENFGISIAEAMASAIPVITTTGTPWKAIKDKNAGWYISVNEKEVIRALEDAMGLEEAKLRKMGLNGREIIIKDYSWKEQIEKLNNVYLWMLGKMKMPECIICE